MLYELGSGKMKKVDVPENHAKNNLVIGTILHLTGYNEPDYIVVKNLGVNERFSHYGAAYLCIDPETLTQTRKEAFTLKYLSEKEDGRIQVYITDRVLPANEVLELWEKSEAKRKRMEEASARAKQGADSLEARGKGLLKKYIPEGAKALIVACLDSNESDVQSDYFAHKTSRKVILGYSKHTRDIFSEMRKHAGKIPETVHLGIGKGHFGVRVVIARDFNSNGIYYYKGAISHWHSKPMMPPEKIFTTKEEAKDFISQQEEPYPITFDGREVSFEWTISEEEIEHREKWSMGDGYYLKDGGRYSNGWRIEKDSYHKIDCKENCISIAERCIFGSFDEA